MITIYKERKIVSRLFAVLLSALLMVPLLSSCGGGSQKANVPPPVDDSVGRTVSNRTTNQPEAKKGLGTGQKVALLAGAAGLYYLYNQHQKASKDGAEGKYYLSKNGRVYYRDAEHRAHFVTAPAEGIRVPESEAQKYRQFQGYNRSTTGRDLTGITSEAAPAL
ncbi:hypothetical protein [Nostoc sp.]|uniref:hypothetical protein n=1 Tax=Nostoc sp. TaxID=1180 RepID=UPI002FF69D65